MWLINYLSYRHILDPIKSQSCFLYRPQNATAIELAVQGQVENQPLDFEFNANIDNNPIIPNPNNNADNADNANNLNNANADDPNPNNVAPPNDRQTHRTPLELFKERHRLRETHPILSVDWVPVPEELKNC
jgi:hypothetical protein